MTTAIESGENKHVGGCGQNKLIMANGGHKLMLLLFKCQTTQLNHLLSSGSSTSVSQTQSKDIWAKTVSIILIGCNKTSKYNITLCPSLIIFLSVF